MLRNMTCCIRRGKAQWTSGGPLCRGVLWGARWREHSARGDENGRNGTQQGHHQCECHLIYRSDKQSITRLSIDPYMHQHSRSLPNLNAERIKIIFGNGLWHKQRKQWKQNYKIFTLASWGNHQQRLQSCPSWSGRPEPYTRRSTAYSETI